MIMAQHIKDYSGYDLYDFLMDQDFKYWALTEDNDAADYWSAVMHTYPEKKQLILEAKRIVISLKKENPSAADRKKAIWDHIENEIDELPVLPSAEKRGVVKRLYKYAAAALLILGVSVAFWLRQDSGMVSVNTGNGESQTILLPDSSVVQLAANSSLTYAKKAGSKKIREVYVSGEAWFKVRHINKNPSQIHAGERFVVHLKHAFDVEVLGTVFSVNDRRGKAMVNLESGAVKVITPQNQLLLKPGESAVMARKKVTVMKTAQQATLVHQWHNHTLLMDKTSVKEVIAVLEDNYGIKINVAVKSILDKQLDGSIPLNDEQRALLILNSITGTQSSRQLDTLTLIPN